MIRLWRNKIGFTTPEQEWFLRMKNKIYAIFLSESFANRKYFNQPEVLKAFQKFIEGKNDDTMLFWRLLNVEIWFRVFFDSKPINELTSPRVTPFGKPNQGKKVEIKVKGKEYARFPIRTELFQKGDDCVKKISKIILRCIDSSKYEDFPDKIKKEKWFIVISE